MLIRTSVLRRIAAGEITLQFRRWRRPTVRSGGQLRTGAGILAIQQVETIALDDLTEADARLAGFAGLEALKEDLESQREGQLYRIRFSLAGPDPRKTLSREDRLTETDVAAIQSMLRKFDASRTLAVPAMALLICLRGHHRIHAAELARQLDCEKQALKLKMRKLKEVGLILSDPDGYTLSARGSAYLAAAAEEFKGASKAPRRDA